MLPAVAVKAAVVEPAATVTESGATSRALLLDTATVAPPAGAALESVTVQLVLPLDPNVVGLQAKDDTSTGATRPTLVFCDWPFRVARMVALRSVGIVPLVALNVAELAPTGTVTLGGVVRVMLLDALNETVLLA
jgi:hypothetical protein